MDSINLTLPNDDATIVWPWQYRCTSTSINTSMNVTAYAIIYFTIPISLLTSACNIIILYTLYKIPAPNSPSNILLVFLSIADLPIGLVVQPIFMLFSIHDMLGVCVSSLRVFHAYLAYFVCGCSALILAAISIDRCIQVSFPLKSRAWNLKKIYICTVCLSWLILGVITSLYVSSTMTSRVFRIVSICFITGILAAAVSSYTIIYYVIRKSTRSVVDFEMNDSTLRHRLVQQKRAAKMIRLIFSVLVACYLPRLLCTLITQTVDVSQATLYHFQKWSAFFIFLNAAINPIIYCAGIDDVRTRVTEILAKITSTLCRTKIQALFA